MTARDRKDARRIEAAFEHNITGESGVSNRRQGRIRPGEREREPLESGPLQSWRREAFGGALTSESTTQLVSNPLPPQEDPVLPSTDMDPATTELVVNQFLVSVCIDIVPC